MSDEADEIIDDIDITLDPKGWAIVLSSLNQVMRENPLCCSLIRPVRDSICEQLEIEP